MKVSTERVEGDIPAVKGRLGAIQSSPAEHVPHTRPRGLFYFFQVHAHVWVNTENTHPHQAVFTWPNTSQPHLAQTLLAGYQSRPAPF